MALPDAVYITQTETLPRALVASCAKSGCRRCGGAGWFRFKGRGNAAWVCPCAQKKVYANVAQAKDKSAPVEAETAIGRAAWQMSGSGLVPSTVLCSADVGGQLRAKEQASDADEETIAGEFRLQLGALSLRVVPDADAPPTFARLFTAEEFEPYEREILAKQRARRAEAEREAKAAESLRRMRADLVKPL